MLKLSKFKKLKLKFDNVLFMDWSYSVSSETRFEKRFMY